LALHGFRAVSTRVTKDRAGAGLRMSVKPAARQSDPISSAERVRPVCIASV
jgi:hypothetical protein